MRLCVLAVCLQVRPTSLNTMVHMHMHMRMHMHMHMRMHMHMHMHMQHAHVGWCADRTSLRQIKPVCANASRARACAYVYRV